MLSFSENTQYNIDENVDDRGKLFDGEMDGDSEFNGWKSQQNIYLQLKVIPQKNVHKKRMSKDFELQNSKLAPMHNSSSSKEPEDENITLRPETSKSFEEPENRLSKEPGQKKVCQWNLHKTIHQNNINKNVLWTKLMKQIRLKNIQMKKHQQILILEIPDRIMN